MKKLFLSLLVFFVFCSFLSAQSPSTSFDPSPLPSITYDYSEMDVASLLSLLSQDLETWNSESIDQEQALKRAYDLLKKTSDELLLAKIDISEIRKSLPLLEKQLTDSQKQKTILQKNNGTLKIITAVSLFAASSSLGYSLGGLPGAAIGMLASVAASFGITLIF